MGKLEIVRELFAFIWIKKKWWLAPVIVFLLVLGILIVFSESSAVAPFIYTLF